MLVNLSVASKDEIFGNSVSWHNDFLMAKIMAACLVKPH